MRHSVVTCVADSPICDTFLGIWTYRDLPGINSTLRKLRIHSVLHRHFFPLTLALATFQTHLTKWGALAYAALCATCQVTGSSVTKCISRHSEKRAQVNQMEYGSRDWVAEVEYGSRDWVAEVEWTSKRDGVHKVTELNKWWPEKPLAFTFRCVRRNTNDTERVEAEWREAFRYRRQKNKMWGSMDWE
jgi:hypothetical protein